MCARTRTHAQKYTRTHVCTHVYASHRGSLRSKENVRTHAHARAKVHAHARVYARIYYINLL
nr:MAG TPA: hypothetical protein [Microviridae sp.]